MSPPIISAKSVAICDTEPIAIEGMRCLLKSQPDLYLVAADTSLLGGMEMLRLHAPAIMILDKTFGIHPVIDCLKRLCASGYAIAPVVWGTNLGQSEAVGMVHAGAMGVVRKTAAIEAVLECLRAVARGSTWMEPGMLPDPEHPVPRTHSNLTARELQVVELVEQGLKNRDIAGNLGISPGTVKIHLKHIFEKTGIRGRYGLALSVVRHKGMLSMSAS